MALSVKGVLRIAAATALVALAWAAAIVVQHWLWRADLRREDLSDAIVSMDEIPPEVLRRIGHFANRQASSFVHFDRAKPDGIVRVCALGDSFTHGSEVSEANDYPSLLQRRLDATHPNRFQVLNFGQGWFGFHQTYILWDEVGRHYDCDVVLIGPSGFYANRDTTFNHSGERNPYYLHARYVLEGDDVRLVDVVGRTLEERFEAYHALAPDRRYLLYDDKPPPALRAFLPTHWTVDNPFYYRPGPDRKDEARDTYRVLLRRLARSGPRVLLGGPFALRRLAATVPEIETFAITWPTSFPYRAPRNHFGPLGNDLVARLFAEHLLEDVDPGLALLRTREGLHADGLASDPPERLGRSNSVVIEIAGEPVGHFTTGASHLDRKGGPGALRQNDVAGLLLVATPPPMEYTDSASPLDGCFLQLPAPPRAGAEVRVETDDGASVVGRVRLWHPGIAVGDVSLDGAEHPRLILLSEDHAGTFALPDPVATALRPTAGAHVRLFVGDDLVAAGPPTKLASKLVRCWVLRSDADALPDVDALPPRGTVDLVTRRADGAARRASIARWERIRLPRPR